MGCEVKISVQEGWLQLLLPGDLDLGRFPTDGSGNEMQDDASTEGRQCF